MNSLRNKLLAWLLGAVALVGAAGAWVSYRNALTEANAFFDDHLRQTALLLRDQAYGFAATPGLPAGSCADPAFTSMRRLTAGCSCCDTTTTRRPLGSVRTS